MFFSILKRISLYFSFNGTIQISPILSVFGWLRFPLLLIPNRLFQFEIYLIIFIIYTLISTLVYYPQSFLNYDFYRYDANLYISYGVYFFFGFTSSHKFSNSSLLNFLNIAFISYLIYIFYWIFLLNGDLNYFSGWFIAKNAFGGFLSIVLIVNFLVLNKINSKFYIFTFIFFFSLLVLSLSRGSLLGFLVSIFAIKLRKKWINIDLLIMLTGLITTIFISFYFFDSSINYLQDSPLDSYIDSETSEKEANILIRATHLWPRAIALFLNSPIVGNGFGSFNDTGLITPIFNDAHAHHSVLHFLSELGIIGTIIYLLFFASLRKFHVKCMHINPLLCDISYYCFFCVFITSLTEHRVTTPSSMLLTMAFIGIFVSQVRGIKKLQKIIHV